MASNDNFVRVRTAEGDVLRLAKADMSAAAGVSTPTNWFGMGSDGDVTVSATTTLARDMFYDNLTVTSTGIIKTDGYRIYVKGTLTVDAGGIIQHDGQSATTRTGAQGAWTGLDSSTFGGGAGANGGNFGNGSNATTSVGNWGGGSGGNGGTGTFNGGTGAVPTVTVRRPRSTFSVANAYSFQSSWGTYTGGGGGGGGAGPSGAYGGGGGGGGGVLHVCANTLTNNGTIRAIGGNGANSQGGNGSGGGGGGGGVLMVSYLTKTGTGTLSVAGGNGGNGSGTGTAGAAGTAGSVYEVAL